MKNLKKIIASVVTLALVGSAMASIPANAEVQDSYTISLQGTVGDTQHWDADAPSVNVTGDGDYSLVFTLDSATESKSGSGVLIMETDINPFDFVEEGAEINDIASDTGINITVSSVVVDAGTDSEKVLDYSFNSGSYRLNDTGSAIRLNIYNTWGNDCTDLDFNFSANTDITVNFTITGLDGNATIGDSNSEIPVVTSTSNKQKDVNYLLYEDIIDKAGKIVSDNGYDNFDNEDGKLGYYVLDINGDGVKELIIAEDFEETSEKIGNTNYRYLHGFYDIYTIVGDSVVEIDQKVLGEKLLEVSSDSYLSLDKTNVAIIDGQLVYVVEDEDDSSSVILFYITGYEQLEDGTLSLTWKLDTGKKSDFPQLTLYDYSDKTPIGGNKDDSPNTSGDTTTTTTANDSNPATGDAGLGTVAIAFTVAGLSAIALRKKD